MTVPSLDMTSQAGLLPPGSLAHPAETDLEVSRLFVRLLKAGYSVRSRAKGESMVPLIHQGDLLTVRPAAFADIRVGNVVAYGIAKDEAAHTLATHRVTGLVRRGPRPHLLIRDDATGWVGAGERVFPEQVYGKVVAIERAGHTVHLDHPLVALADCGRIKLVHGIAAGKGLVRRVLPDRLWSWLQQAARHIPQFRRNSRAPGSDVTVQPFAGGSSGQPTRLTREPPTAGPQLLPRDVHTALALDLQVEPHPDLLVERLGDQVLLIPATDRLVDMESVYTLNTTGAEVWDMITAGRPVGDLVHDLAAQFAVDSQHAAQDLYRFLAELMTLGMVRLVGRSSDRLASIHWLPGAS